MRKQAKKMPEVKKRVVFDSKPNGEILSTDWNECSLVKKEKRRKKKKNDASVLISFALFLYYNR